MNRGVQRRTALLITLAALIPLLLVWALALLISYQAAQKSAQQRQVILTQLLASDFSRQIVQIEGELRVFGESLLQLPEIDRVSDEQLDTFLLSNPSFAEIGLYTGEGQRRAQATRFPPSILPAALDPQLLDAVRLGLTFYQDPPPLQALSVPLVSSEIPRLRMALPLQVLSGLRYVLVADISVDQIWDLNRRLEAATGSRVLVLTEEGSLISASETQLLLDQPPIAQTPLFSQRPVDGVAIAVYESPIRDEVLGTRTAIPPLGWQLVLERPAEEIYQDVRALALNLLLVILAALPLIALAGWLAGRRIARPIQQLHASVESFARDPHSFQPVRLTTRDELEALGVAFETMATNLRESQASLAQVNEELEGLVATRTLELQQALEELKERSRAQEQLLETVKRLGLPVIPITRGMLVMPLVGEISSERADEISVYLLRAIERERALVALIDITGVPVVDTTVAQALVNAVMSAQLLGVRVVLSGIRPEIAETLVSLGIDFRAIPTKATLEQGFVLGMQLLDGKQARSMVGRLH